MGHVATTELDRLFETVPRDAILTKCEARCACGAEFFAIARQSETLLERAAEHKAQCGHPIELAVNWLQPLKI